MGRVSSRSKRWADITGDNVTRAHQEGDGHNEVSQREDDNQKRNEARVTDKSNDSGAETMGEQNGGSQQGPPLSLMADPEMHQESGKAEALLWSHFGKSSPYSAVAMGKLSTQPLDW